MFLTKNRLANPLLEKLNSILWEQCDLGLIVVYPSTKGWAQLSIGDEKTQPRFCRLVQASEQGAKHCRMCHLLISVAACNGGETAPRCHAGASVLLSPIPMGQDECAAVVSTCMSHEDEAKEVWREACRRALKLGIPESELMESGTRLPSVSRRKLALAKGLMEAAGVAVAEVWRRACAERKLDVRSNPREPSSEVQEAVERELRGALKRDALPTGSKDRKNDLPLIVEIVSDLVKRRPDMPFTLKEIAAAARITPNHFSYVFHQHYKQRFSDFIIEQRMALAQNHLRDLTMNITEVAAESGFDDPGYFARRFRQKYGMSPREWRNSLLHS